MEGWHRVLCWDVPLQMYVEFAEVYYCRRKKGVQCCWHFFKRIGGFCAVRFNEDRIQYEYRYHIHYFMNIPLYTSYFAIDFFNKV